MSTLIKVLTNSVLVIVLLGIMAIPIGSMAIIRLDEKASVLSAQDVRTDENQIPDYTQREVPKDVEDFIIKMEKEFYQSSESAPAQE